MGKARTSCADILAQSPSARARGTRNKVAGGGLVQRAMIDRVEMTGASKAVSSLYWTTWSRDDASGGRVRCTWINGRCDPTRMLAEALVVANHTGRLTMRARHTPERHSRATRQSARDDPRRRNHPRHVRQR